MLDFGWQAKDVIEAGRTTAEAVETINKWLKESPFPLLTEEQMVLFLLSCNSDISATQTTIAAYYNVTHGSPNLFNNRDIRREELQHIQKITCYGVMPTRTAEGYAVVYHRLRDSTYWQYYMEDAMKVLFMSLDLVLMGESPPNGLVVLFDMKGVGLMHLTRIRMNAVRGFFRYLQEGLPIQLKQIHVLNSVYFVDKILAIVKPFMKMELMNMLNFYPSNFDMEDFFTKHLSKDCVPCDYGGNLPSVEELHTKTIEEMIKQQRYFEDGEAQRKFYKPR